MAPAKTGPDAAVIRPNAIAIARGLQNLSSAVAPAIASNCFFILRSFRKRRRACARIAALRLDSSMDKRSSEATLGRPVGNRHSRPKSRSQNAIRETRFGSMSTSGWRNLGGNVATPRRLRSVGSTFGRLKYDRKARPAAVLARQDTQFAVDLLHEGPNNSHSKPVAAGRIEPGRQARPVVHDQ